MIKRSIFIPAILILSSIYGLVLLGFWQLERADEKRAIEHEIVLAQQSPAQLITSVDELLDKEHYQVLLKGRYDTNKQFIYDNQIVKGNAGYYVLTPFILSDKTAILVNRGFVPWHGKREQLANIKLDNLPRVIKVGLIKPVERIKLKQQPIKPNFPILIQSLNLDELSMLSNYQIVVMLARLDVKASDGFFRQWQPFYGSVDKHLGYALQWFLMALVLGIIALRLLMKKNKKN